MIWLGFKIGDGTDGGRRLRERGEPWIPLCRPPIFPFYGEREAVDVGYGDGLLYSREEMTNNRDARTGVGPRPRKRSRIRRN